MFTMHEAFARERMREEHQRSQRSHVVRAVAAHRRWQRRERQAHAAERRHAQGVQRAVSAVAEYSWR